MEVILANTCLSFTGSPDRTLGYSIQRRKDGFFAKRNSKGFVPKDGHWNFICLCAELAQKHLYLSDIRVSHQELSEALSEAGLAPSLRDSDIPGFRDSGLPSSGASDDSSKFFSASDILTLKERISL